MKTVGKETIVLCSIAASGVNAFAPITNAARCTPPSALFFFKGGSGAKDLDEEWERQQELLRLRQAPPEVRDKYFQEVEERRMKATQEQVDKWGWQKKQYAKGEDPIDEWRKRRESGQISDLENQYGDPKKVGGIPLPMASFGVGGEFGVGGKFDNGGRFDLRLPYAEQGWVDEDAQPLFSNWFGGKDKTKPREESKVEEAPAVEEPKKKGFWPF